MTDTLDGHHVIAGVITIPADGAWTADVTLDEAVSLSGMLTLSIAGLSLRCSPWRPVVPFHGRTRARLVAGANGWPRVVKAKPYRHLFGVKLSTILGDVAKEVGETVSIDSDRVLGKFYTRAAEPGSRFLNRHAPGGWWIDFDGVTQLRARASSVVSSTITVIDFDGARGRLLIAADKPGDILPGRTISSTALASSIRIGSVMHTIGGTSLRTEVLAA